MQGKLRHPRLAASRKSAYNSIMSNRKKTLITPSQLVKAFAYPFPVVIGGFALTLTLACLTVGVNPIPLVIGFLHESTQALLPLIGSLAVIWGFYTVLYLTAVRTSRGFFSLQQNPALASTPSPAWRVMSASVPQPECYLCFLQEELPTPLHTAFPTLVGTRWHPGTHPMLI